MSAELKKVSREYAERVCNGDFPITYSREQVVNHTANDFTEGWNRSIDENKTDWFKAGGMAERILIDWEMKQLKEKLQKGIEGHEHLVAHFNRSEQENQELRGKVVALEQRIKMLVEKAECQNQ